MHADMIGFVLEFFFRMGVTGLLAVLDRSFLTKDDSLVECAPFGDLLTFFVGPSIWKPLAVCRDREDCRWYFLVRPGFVECLNS
jgi:hypothetical protein